jgi:DNA-binding LacI/PurR family transcriptional regulator
MKHGIAGYSSSNYLSDRSKKRVQEIGKRIVRANTRTRRPKLNIKSRKKKIIGVIVPEINHDFFSTAISGIEEIAYESGYTVLVCQSDEDYKKEVACVNILLRKQVAGVLVSISQHTKTDDHFSEFRRRNIPLVFFDRACDDCLASKVKIDDYKSAYEAVTYLVRRGYKRIAHFSGPKELGISVKRLIGYLDALNRSKKQQDRLVYYGGLQEHDGYNLMDALIQNHTMPDAIFAVNDPVALGAYKRIKEAGLKIPKDIALMGFSNNTITSFTSPQLTTIDQPSLEMGRKSAELLIGTIEKKITEIRTLILDTKLIIREST